MRSKWSMGEGGGVGGVGAREWEQLPVCVRVHVCVRNWNVFLPVSSIVAAAVAAANACSAKIGGMYNFYHL